MLREGQRLKKQGVDVVIGIVETDGRAETQEQIGDLEIVPPRIIEYRGVKLREMDLNAILARRTTVCLVDELAHTNVPGSKHSKRYQDAEELLLDGIHVITTVNIQHFESLYDEIERTTGVKVKERFPQGRFFLRLVLTGFPVSHGGGRRSDAWRPRRSCSPLVEDEDDDVPHDGHHLRRRPSPDPAGVLAERSD
jgi:hypothetical protein